LAAGLCQRKRLNRRPQKLGTGFGLLPARFWLKSPGFATLTDVFVRLLGDNLEGVPPGVATCANGSGMGPMGSWSRVRHPAPGGPRLSGLSAPKWRAYPRARQTKFGFCLVADVRKKARRFAQLGAMGVG